MEEDDEDGSLRIYSFETPISDPQYEALARSTLSLETDMVVLLYLLLDQDIVFFFQKTFFWFFKNRKEIQMPSTKAF